MRNKLLIAALLLIETIAFTQERIAVFPFEDMDNVFTGSESRSFYSAFSNEFTNRNDGRFSVVPRQEIERLINTEAAFQLSDFSSREKTAEMQRVLNGTRILSGLIGKVGNSINISVSLYTYPELVQLPGGASLRVSNIVELFDKIPELVQSMQTTIAGSSSRPPAASINSTTVIPTNKTYNIGDTGPAGGYIFYDKGVFSDGWRYLEAAPAEYEFSAQWGLDGFNVRGTSNEVGKGKANTELIFSKLRQLGDKNRAADLCMALDINGFKDWFLPSKDELNLMYRNLKQKELGGLDGWYWSSTQSVFNSTWIQIFINGKHSLQYKSQTFIVRAVRSF